MNHDENSPDLSTLIDPELEARVVAWVVGEASPFEVAELTRLTGEKPELAIFKRRLEAVSGLVAEAIRPDGTPLRLASERRAKLLQALGATDGQTSASKSAPVVLEPMAVTKKKHRKDSRWLYPAAACLTVGLFTLLSIPAYQRVLSMERASAMMKAEPRSEPVLTASTGDSSRLNFRSFSNEEARKQDLELFGLSDSAMPAKEREANSPSYSARQNSAETFQRTRFSSDSAAAAKPSAPAPATIQTGETLSLDHATLDGHRLRTDLRDVGSAVTVVTKEFMKDIGATDNQTHLQYTAGTQVGGVQGNFVGPRPDTPAVTGPELAKKSDGRVAGHDASSDLADDKITLNPFEVSADKDAGYKAESTLASGRVAQPDGTLDEEKRKARSIDSVSETIEADPAPAPRPISPPTESFSEVSAAKKPVSTFSLHVSDVSFRLAQAALANGQSLDAASLRPEEFYNAFSYGDPTPVMAEKVSCRVEQAAHPFVQQRNLVRIAVKVASSGRDAAQPLHLTVLLDTSGSMEREDRAATVRSAMQSLISLLSPNDRLTLIGFARTPRLLADALPGDQAASVLDLIKNTPAEGGTNLEAALALGRELAERHLDPAAQNRIVLLTDGAANLGNANPAELAATIEELRQQKIAFDACGVGLTGLDDGMLENLTRKGDGRYYVLNSPAAADAGFAKQLAGAFRPAAENVKLQVRFNPARVGHYRLIGFEQHRLREEDFRNDSVDAAELAAEEAAVAVYQVEALPQGEGELGEVYVRFRDAATGDMVERNWTLNYDAHAPAFDRATPSMQLAGTAALLAEKLRGGEAGDVVTLADLAPIVNRLRSHYANESRVQEFVTMFEQARKLAGE